MAKVHNITLPDGTTIPVPAWATEDTMTQVAGYMAASNKVDQKFLGLMKGLGADVTDLQREISSLVTGVKNTTKNETALDAADATSKGFKNIANSVMKASNFFGDAEKPMTSLVSATGTLTDGLKGLDEGFIKRLMPEGSALGKFFGKFGGTLDVATDAGLALLGWNAAKFEQFADAQKLALEAGAIFYSSGDQFDQLYSRSMDAGVSYNNMMEAVNQFGGTLTGLGGSVSAGTDNFIHMFDNLNDMADGFGDLGLTSKDMLNQYGQFLEYARLSGRLGNATLDAGDKINKSFIDLTIESAGLANLTALSKSEAMSRQLAAMTEPLTALGKQTLLNNGLTAQAAMVDTFVGQLGMIAPEAPEFQGVLDAISRELAETSDNIETFDIGRRLDGNLRGALDTALGTDFIPTINEAIRTGNMANADAETYIIRSLANVNQTKLASAGAASGSILRLVQDIQASGFIIEKNFSNYLKMSKSDREKYNKEFGEAMGVSGKSVVIMNKATEQFYQLQDALTFPMQTTADTFEFIAEGLQKGAAKIKEFFGLSSEEDDFGSVIKEDGNQTPSVDSTNPIPGNGNSPTQRVPVPNTSTVFDPSGNEVESEDINYTEDSEQTAENLNSLSEHVRDRFKGTISEFNETYGGEGYRLLLAEGYRSVQDSNELYNSGEISTPGGQSYHNYGMAGDFLIYKDGELIQNDNNSEYTLLSEIANRHGLNNPVNNDTGHFQPSEMPVAVPVELSTIAKTSSGNRSLMEQQAVEMSEKILENGNTESPEPASIPDRTTETDNPSEQRRTVNSDFGMRELLEADSDLYEQLTAAYNDHVKNTLSELDRRANRGDKARARMKATNEVYPLFADRINEALGREAVTVTSRRMGGSVGSNKPYVVGDQLGMENAELFVPEESGTIVNNTDFKTMLQNSSNLTNTDNSSIIEDLEKEYDNLLLQKAEAVSTALALKDTIKLIHGTKHQKARIDRINSA